MKVIRVKYSIEWPAKTQITEMIVHENFNFDKFFNDSRLKLIERTYVEIEPANNYYFSENLIYKYDLMSEASVRRSFEFMTGQPAA